MSVGLDSTGRARTVIVLAAGEGKRMRSALPKVLHPVLGRSMLGHVLACVREALEERDRIVVVVGHGAERVREHLARIAPDALPVLQAEQRGTGHAAGVALAALDDVTDGTVVVLNGDIPLLRPQTLAGLIAAHETARAAATVLTAEVADPKGLGRIVRTGAGAFAGIVEDRDATPEQRAIREINAGAYAFDAATLRDTLGKLSANNDQGEEYLTDVVGLLTTAGLPVVAHRADDPTDALGANDRAELAVLRSLLRDRINTYWMRFGVTIVDPATTWVDVTVSLGRDAVIEPNTHLRGATEVAEGALVGPDTTLIDTTIGSRAVVVRAYSVGATVGAGARVGPYAYLRPGTQLAPHAKVAPFVATPHQANLSDTGDDVGIDTDVPSTTGQQ